jgi:hypothetical protein
MTVYVCTKCAPETSCTCNTSGRAPEFCTGAGSGECDTQLIDSGCCDWRILLDAPRRRVTPEILQRQFAQAEADYLRGRGE